MAAELFTIGGTVQAGTGVYVRRQADDDLLTCCLRGDYAYVLAPRQVGKSSLMVNVAEELERSGVRCARVDLTEVGETEVTGMYCYRKILTLIASRIGLGVDVAEWWAKNAEESINARFIAFFEEVVLRLVAGPVVIFLDEIDFTLEWKFSDDFFAAIRYLYNGRSQNAELKRLSFVLLGVATPIDLVKDVQRTPFNIGTAIDMNDFSLEETIPLAAGLGLSPEATKSVARTVLSWTDGHPYLTQRLLSVLAGQRRDQWTVSEIDEIVRRVFLDDRSSLDHNLAHVARSLTTPGLYTYRMLSTYRKVLGRIPVMDDARSAAKAHLKLTGVVKRSSHGTLRVRNRLYATLFGPEWVRDQRAIRLEQAMRQAYALAAGLFVLSLVLAGYTWYERMQTRKSEATAQLEQKLRHAAVIAADALVAKNEQLNQANTELEQQESQLRAANDEEARLRELADLSVKDALRNASQAQLQTALANNASASASANAEKEAASRGEAERSLGEKKEALDAKDRLAGQLSAAVISASARNIAASETDSTDLGVLLGVEGYNRQPDTDALNTVAATLNHLPRRYVVGKVLNVGTLALNDHGDELAVGNRSGEIRRFAVRSGRQGSEPKLPTAVQLLAFNESSVVGVDQKGNTTDKLPRSNATPDRSHVPAIKADGTAYATIEADRKTVDYWMAGNSTPHKLTTTEPCKSAAFSGEELFALCEGAVYRWKLSGFDRTRIEMPRDATDQASGFAVYSPEFPLRLDAYFNRLATTSIRLLLMNGDAVSVYTVRPQDHGFWPVTHTAYRAFRLFDLPHESPVVRLVISPYGGEVTTATSSAVRRWSLSTGRETLRIYLAHRLSAVAVSGDDRWLATAENDGTLTVWMTSAGPVLSHGSVAASSSTTGQVGFSEDNEVWRLEGRFLQPWQWELDQSPNGLEVSGIQSSRFVWMSADGSHALRIPYNYSFAVPSRGSPNLFSKNNAPAALAGVTTTVNYSDLRSRSQTLVAVPRPIQASAISSNGIYFAVGSGIAISVYKSGLPFSSIPFLERVSGLAPSPDGRILLAATEGKVHILKDGAEAEPPIPVVPQTQSLPTSSLCFSLDGALFAIAEGTRIRIFDTATLQEIKTITKVSAASPTFSPDGKSLAAISQGAVLIWNLDEVTKAGATADSDRPAVPSNFIAPAAAPVTALAFSPSGRYLATNGNDGLRVWYWRPSDIVAEACSRVRREEKKLSADEWKNYISRNTKEPYRETPTCPRRP